MRLKERLTAPDTPDIVEQRSAIYKEVFGTPQGQKVLSDILNRICGVDAPGFTNDALGLAYNQARRDVGLEIARLVWLEFNKKQTPEVKKA